MGEALEASASAGGLAEPIVRLEGIWKSFGRIEVLTDVSLSVQKGEVVCIIGPSGAGKSTLLRCINYLEPIVRLEAIWKSFGKIEVLTDVSLAVQKG